MTLRLRTARPLSEAELVVRQVTAIDAWHAARRTLEQAERDSPPTSREQQLDRARRADAARRQHAAMVERTERHLRQSGHLLQAAVPHRAVVAHRDPWFGDRLCQGLADQGVDVLCRVDNGAEAVGVVVVEQPDLLVVEDRLPMVGGVEVLRQALPLSPATVAAAQASSETSAAELAAAGARDVALRRVPPDEVVTRVLALLD